MCTDVFFLELPERELSVFVSGTSLSLAFRVVMVV